MPTLSDFGIGNLHDAGIREYPGYRGAFTRQTAPGSYPAGTRIEKVVGEPDDGHEIGEKGTVLGSVGNPLLGYAYFIEWDADKGFAVMARDKKIAVIV